MKERSDKNKIDEAAGPEAKESCPQCELDRREEAAEQRKSDLRRREIREQEEWARRHERRIYEERDFMKAKVLYHRTLRDYEWAQQNCESIRNMVERLERDCANGTNPEDLRSIRDQLDRAEDERSRARRELERAESYFIGDYRLPRPKPRPKQEQGQEQKQEKPTEIEDVGIIEGIGATCSWYLCCGCIS